MARNKQKDMKSILVLHYTVPTVPYLLWIKITLFLANSAFGGMNLPKQDQLHNVSIEKNFYKPYAHSTYCNTHNAMAVL